MAVFERWNILSQNVTFSRGERAGPVRCDYTLLLLIGTAILYLVLVVLEAGPRQGRGSGGAKTRPGHGRVGHTRQGVLVSTRPGKRREIPGMSREFLPFFFSKPGKLMKLELVQLRSLVLSKLFAFVQSVKTHF
jgi:hypothetical protein